MNYSESEIKTILFENYIGQLITETNFCLRRLKDNNTAYLDIYKRVLYSIFRSYRENLASLNLDEQHKDRCFRKPNKDEKNEYVCSENTEKTTFPLNRILEYRNEKFPEYIDDYGMQTFIEVTDYKGDIKHIQTNDMDWDYELDRIFDVERLSNIEIDKTYDLLLNDNWYKII